VLIGKAKRRKTPPAIHGMYDLRRWRQWWTEARTATDGAADRSSRTTSAPSPACPYQGLSAYEAADQARFFGRARSVSDLVALINKVQGADPGIVLLTGPSGAG